MTLLALCGGILIGVSGLTVASPAARNSVLSKLGMKGSPALVNAGSTTGAPVGGADNNAAVSPELAQAVMADYKQDVGIFFEAWKTLDMEGFRNKIAKAYTGPLIERHSQQAKEYITAGVGMEVSQIHFIQITVEKADAMTATLQAEYRYTGQDYLLAAGEVTGEKHEQRVNIRVNLVKLEERWLIAGETSLP
jgi:hypothetical protein